MPRIAGLRHNTVWLVVHSTIPVLKYTPPTLKKTKSSTEKLVPQKPQFLQKKFQRRNCWRTQNLIKVSFRPFVALRYKSVEKSQGRVTSGVVRTCKACYLQHPGSQEEEETSAIKLSDQQLLEKHHQSPGPASSSVVRHSIRTCSKMRVIGLRRLLRPRLLLRVHAQKASASRETGSGFSVLLCAGKLLKSTVCRLPVLAVCDHIPHFLYFSSSHCPSSAYRNGF